LSLAVGCDQRRLHDRPHEGEPSGHGEQRERVAGAVVPVEPGKRRKGARRGHCAEHGNPEPGNRHQLDGAGEPAPECLGILDRAPRDHGLENADDERRDEQERVEKLVGCAVLTDVGRRLEPRENDHVDAEVERGQHSRERERRRTAE